MTGVPAVKKLRMYGFCPSLELVLRYVLQKKWW